MFTIDRASITTTSESVCEGLANFGRVAVTGAWPGALPCGHNRHADPHEHRARVRSTPRDRSSHAVRIAVQNAALGRLGPPVQRDDPAGQVAERDVLPARAL